LPEQLEEATERIVWMMSLFRRYQVQGGAMDVEAAKQPNLSVTE
jgi:hypothetical protein